VQYLEFSTYPFTSLFVVNRCVLDFSAQFLAFCNALTAGGVDLSEPEEMKPEYQPGIDYDDAEALADLERRQWLVHDLGTKSSATRALIEQQRTRGRRRPRTKPTPLEAPTWKAD